MWEKREFICLQICDHGDVGKTQFHFLHNFYHGDVGNSQFLFYTDLLPWWCGVFCLCSVFTVWLRRWVSLYRRLLIVTMCVKMTVTNGDAYRMENVNTSAEVSVVVMVMVSIVTQH